MDINENKKVVCITGANGQLGKAINNKLFPHYKIYNLDISYSIEQLDEYHHNLDISDEKKVRDFYKIINPDIIINNAGVSVFSNFLNRSSEELNLVYDVNLKGTINMINEFARVNQDNLNEKSIINIASLYGIVSADPRIYTDTARNSPEIYAATKAGVIQLTKYYCVHLSDKKIRVNAISPGGIFNPDEPQGDDFIKNYSYRCPMKKMGSAEDIANGVFFLASEDSSYINGHNLVIDGGFTAW
jgi:NAD(P)-dependent dehydrogenase (short-subunit alcohol dehydrogenase family)